MKTLEFGNLELELDPKIVLRTLTYLVILGYSNPLCLIVLCIYGRFLFDVIRRLPVLNLFHFLVSFTLFILMVTLI